MTPEHSPRAGRLSLDGGGEKEGTRKHAVGRWRVSCSGGPQLRVETPQEGGWRSAQSVPRDEWDRTGRLQQDFARLQLPWIVRSGQPSPQPSRALRQLAIADLRAGTHAGDLGNSGRPRSLVRKDAANACRLNFTRGRIACWAQGCGAGRAARPRTEARNAQDDPKQNRESIVVDGGHKRCSM